MVKVSKRDHSKGIDDNEHSLLMGSNALSSESSEPEVNPAFFDRKRDRTQQAYRTLIAGLSSGTVSATVCAPLDLLRTRIQVMGEIVDVPQKERSFRDHVAIQMIRDIVRKDGIGGCFRGLTATLLTVPTFWGAYFSFYDHFKWEWTRRFPEHPLSMIHLGSAITAGAISDLLCNPMFVVRTRLQTESLHQQSNSALDKGAPSSQRTIQQTVQVLYAEGGVLIFWRGMSANMLGLSHVAVQFPVYEKLKVLFRGDKIEGEEKTADLLLSSGISKMSASILTYPHEVIRSRMMDIRSTRGIGFLNTCSRVYSMEGLKGFYAGISVSLIRVIPNTMLTFLVYERTLQLMKTRSDVFRF